LAILLDKTSPAGIRLRLLGRLVLARGDDVPVRLSTRKAGALIAYLAMQDDQAASREELATLLWGSCSDAQARQSLRQALAFLRKDLGSHDLFAAGPDVVRLKAGLWSVDARELDALSKSLDPHDLQGAAERFAGDFLAGLNIDEEGFAEWVRAQRMRTGLAAARLCETFATRADLVRDGGQAVVAAERLLALDPSREDWQRLVLTLSARYRGTREALAHAAAFGAMMQRERGVDLEPATRHLIERIRNGEIAPVVTANAHPSAAPLMPDVPSASQESPAERIAPPGSARPSWRVRPLAAAVAVATVIVGGALGLLPYRPQSAQPPAPAAPAAPPSDAWQPPQVPSERQTAGVDRRGRGITPIIVLPFGTHGTADPIQTLADALTDDLTNMLSRVASLRVISRQTARRYRDRQTDVAAIGAELQVRYVLEGSVRMHDGKLRVHVELIDPLTRLPAWSTRIERRDGEQRTVQDEIVMRLARELHFEVLKADSERVSGNPTVYELTRVGWKAIFDHGIEGMAALTRAKTAFAEVLERDAENWSARSGLGAYHTLVGSLRYGADWSEHLDRGEQILAQVMAERPNEQGPYFYLSIVHRMRGRFPEAVAALERCIEITPSAAPCYAHIGHALVQQGRAGEGVPHINYALRLSPHDMTRSHWLRFAGDAQIELGNLEAAIGLLRESYAANPRQPPTLRSLAAVHALSGNMNEAQRFVAELKAVAPHNSAGRPRSLLDTMQPELTRGLRIAFAPRM
jgi:DNA-binding SARP family transcriptional activator/TolB-like protein/tetratricopeptide (TPR) repeat protein